MTVSPNKASWSNSNKRLFTDPVFVAVFALVAVLLVAKITQTRLLELAPNELLFDRPLLSNGSYTEEQPPIELGAVGKPGHSRMLVRLDFKVSDTSDYPNLLQTDSFNRGLRLELSERSLTLIVGTPIDGSPPQAFTLPKTLSIEKWHNLFLRMVEGHYVDIKIDGVGVESLISAPFSMQNVRVGIGFDDKRRFRGAIKDINIFVGSSPFIGIWLAIPDVLFSWLLGLFLIVIAQRYFAFYSPLPADLLRLSALKRGARRVRPTLLSPIIFLSILLNLSALCYSIASHHFIRESDIILKALLPGFERLNGAPPFNSTLLAFVLLEMSLIGTLAVFWTSTLFVKFRSNLLSKNNVVAATCASSVTLLIVIDGNVPRLFTACAIALPVLHLMLGSRIANAFPTAPLLAAIAILRRTNKTLGFVSTAASKIRAAVSQIVLRQNPYLSTIVGKCLPFAGGILLCGIVAWPIFQAWFPVVIPNDYVEATNFFRIRNPTGAVAIAQNEVAECLSVADSGADVEEAFATVDPANNFKCRGLDLSEDKRIHLQNTIKETSKWQGEVGRTLFHHSYIFVPAQHFLTYGFDRAVPYLYGYGNTIFHAFLMRLDGGPTLSSYFSTFPIAEIAGLSGIALLVLLVTRSGWLTLSGFALSLIAFYSITYVPIFLAASFSPARYVGLLLQLASICICCRNTGSSRFLLLPFAAAASLFWNAEFALLGIVGQALLAIAPGMRLTLTQRAVLLASLVACPLGYANFVYASPDIIKTVQLSFFNVGMPFMDRTDAAWFFVDLVAAEVLLFCMSMLFSGNERTLRLCYLPVLALLMVKYIYNPAPPHLYLVYTLLWPMFLLYLPPLFSMARAMPVRNASIGAPLIAAVTMSFAVLAGSTYKEDATAFRSLLIDDFVIGKWSSLGESIGFVTPERSISERVESIKKQVMPGDILIILSPYDQVLNFYINPQAICGHFDLLSNLATHDIENTVLACATRSSKTLIVYDRASETPCPTGYLQTQSRCALKATTKRNLTNFRDRLLPFVELVGSDEHLLFYRPTGPSARNANASIN